MFFDIICITDHQGIFEKWHLNKYSFIGIDIYLILLWLRQLGEIVMHYRGRRHVLPSICLCICLPLCSCGRAPKAHVKRGHDHPLFCSKRGFITKLMNSVNLQRTDSLSPSSLRCDGTAASLTEGIGCMRTASFMLKVCLMQIQML